MNGLAKRKRNDSFGPFRKYFILNRRINTGAINKLIHPKSPAVENPSETPVIIPITTSKMQIAMIAKNLGTKDKRDKNWIVLIINIKIVKAAALPTNDIWISIFEKLTSEKDDHNTSNRIFSKNAVIKEWFNFKDAKSSNEPMIIEEARRTIPETFFLMNFTFLLESITEAIRLTSELIIRSVSRKAASVRNISNGETNKFSKSSRKAFLILNISIAIKVGRKNSTSTNLEGKPSKETEKRNSHKSRMIFKIDFVSPGKEKSAFLSVFSGYKQRFRKKHIINESGSIRIIEEQMKENLIEIL